MTEWFRGAAGERGKSGDHGQEGARGRDGRQGIDGRDGIGAYSEPDELIAAAVASNRLHLWDKRLLIIFGIFILAMILLFQLLNRELDQFRHAVIANCEQVNDGNRKVNDLLDTLSRNALSNPARTEERRMQIAERYAGLKLPISQCPPR